MSRKNAPLSLDAACTRVKAKAAEWLAQSAAGPAAWGRTFVEPDKNVYVTVAQKESLVSKWEGLKSADARFYHAGSFSQTAFQVDLKLQLENDWGTWKKGTSPFVYHIPFDTYYSPEMIKADELAKKTKEDAAKQKLVQEANEAKAKEDKVAKDKAAKLLLDSETKRKQAMATEFNRLKPVPKGDEKTKWEKAWVEKNKARKF